MDEHGFSLDPLARSLYDQGLITDRICVMTLKLDEGAVRRYFAGDETALTYDEVGRISFLAFTLNGIVRETSTEDSLQDHLAVLTQSGFPRDLIARWIGLDPDTFERMLMNPAQEPGAAVRDFADRLCRLTTAVQANRDDKVVVEEEEED